mmetsp:Transcript_1946/g.2509  ORF Transcript_1946/g.2509 Transcript_1946/m.2509 type:complete len:308 (+) Transcript_1946:146-1069(+)
MSPGDNSSEEDEVVRDPLPKRLTRGKRMDELVGEAAEADEEFWGQKAWEELSEDEEISSDEFDSEEQIDIEDSDFDALDEDAEFKKDEEDAAVFEKEEKARKRRGMTNQTRSGYLDPALKRKRPQPQRKRPQKSTKGSTIQRVILPSSRELRRSTKVKTENVVKSQKLAHTKINKPGVKRRKVEEQVPKLSQQQLLEEAAKTEIENKRSLAAMLMLQEEKKKSRTSTKIKKEEARIIFKSTKDANTLTFVHLNEIPRTINAKPIPYPTKRVCKITGKPAKYRDPLSGEYYATFDAFKKLRAKIREKK